MEQTPHKVPTRFYEIDLLRFLAAFAVVLNHYAWRNAVGTPQITSITYPALAPLAKYGLMGVQLFFIISGYVVLMSAQGKTVREFFISRITRLYPAFWAACTLTYFVGRIFWPAPSDPTYPVFARSFWDYLSNLTMLQEFAGHRHIDNVYWSLTVEIGFYFLIAVSMGWKLLKHLPLLLLLWLGYVAVVGPTPERSALHTLLLGTWAPYFAAGMLFYLLQHNMGKSWQLYGLLALAYGLALRLERAEAAARTAELDSFSFVVQAALVTLFFALFFLIITRRLNLQQFGWLSRLGALTYPLYLIHAFLGYLAFQHLGPYVNKYALLLGLIGAALLVAYLIHHLIEKQFSRPLGRAANKVLSRIDA